MSDDAEFWIDGDEAAGGVAVEECPTPAAPRATAKDGAPLYADLETVPDESRLASFNLPALPQLPTEANLADLPDTKPLLSGSADSIKVALNRLGVLPPAYLDQLAADEKDGKGRVGVFEMIAKGRSYRQSILDAYDDRIKLLSTTPEYCQICAIGVAIGNNDVRSFVVGDPHPTVAGSLITERDIIESFWSRVAQCSPLIGYHIVGFDIPVILARSAILGIEPTRQLDLSPWGTDVADLYLKRFGARGNTSREKPGKLKELCPLYGIPVPAEGVDGSHVYQLMKTPEGRTAVGSYVRSDTHILREFHRRLSGYFWT